MTLRIIHIHPQAPAKPALGAPCNGCGVCCLVEPCPVGMVLSLKRRGACAKLRWVPEQARYRCGLMTATAAGRPSLLQRLAARWIAAGAGCDADLDLGLAPDEAPVPTDAP